MWNIDMYLHRTLTFDNLKQWGWWVLHMWVFCPPSSVCLSVCGKANKDVEPSQAHLDWCCCPDSWFGFNSVKIRIDAEGVKLFRTEAHYFGVWSSHHPKNNFSIINTHSQFCFQWSWSVFFLPLLINWVILGVTDDGKYAGWERDGV